MGHTLHTNYLCFAKRPHTTHTIQWPKRTERIPNIERHAGILKETTMLSMRRRHVNRLKIIVDTNLSRSPLRLSHIISPSSNFVCPPSARNVRHHRRHSLRTATTTKGEMKTITSGVLSEHIFGIYLYLCWLSFSRGISVTVMWKRSPSSLKNVTHTI